MRPFEFSQQTKVICDSPVSLRAVDAASIFGRKVLVVTGSTSAHALGVLPEVIAALAAAEIPHALMEGVSANPGVATVDAGASLAMGEECDVVLAIGGGSVIDAAKAMAVGAATKTSIRGQLSGIRGPDDRIGASLPTIAIPTLLGSGSETNGTCVLTDETTGRKLSAHSDLAAPRIAFLDPTLAAVAPRPLIAAGIADALAHAIEAGLSQRATLPSDSFAQAAVSLLLEYGEGASWGDIDAVAHCQWAANLAGQALTMAGSVVTHPLSHPLSARLGAHHGEAVAALEPAVLDVFQREWGQEALKVGRWFSARGLTPSSAIQEVRERYTKMCTTVGITRSIFDLGMRGELVERFVEDVLASGSRGLSNTLGTQLRESQLRDVYLRALKV